MVDNENYVAADLEGTVLRLQRDLFETACAKERGVLSLDASAAAFSASQDNAARLTNRVVLLEKQPQLEQDLRIQVT